MFKLSVVLVDVTRACKIIGINMYIFLTISFIIVWFRIIVGIFNSFYSNYHAKLREFCDILNNRIG